MQEELKKKILENIEITNECWIWKKGKDSKGYGVLSFNGERIRAHRASCHVFNSPVEDWQIVRHSCDNPSCCNPKHLTAGNQSENIQEMWDRKRRPKESSRGEGNGNCRMTDLDYSRLLDLVVCGLFSQRRIARMVGVSKTTVARAYRGEGRGFHDN